MAPYPLDKQTAGYNSPVNWLMNLAMDLAALCDMWKTKWHKWMSFGISRISSHLEIWRDLRPSFRPINILPGKHGVNKGKHG